ncbi:uncharacterized protein [Argopecten irradians]|uniref:uncharacterized protein n=1 Tax=Argopecten irradians TaxID=31199 RepID=UPI0037217EDE
MAATWFWDQFISKKTVIVHVANKLEADGVTIHWHGLGQHDTPWMDGTGSISQCPIDPGSSFVYRFVAEDVGTSFYHAHHGMLRAEGIAGPVIVLPRDTNRADKATADIEKEYVMFLQDWFYSTGNEIYSHITDQLTPFYHGLDQDGCSTLSKAPDGEIISDVPFESAIINGKGRFNHTQSIGGIPYETFNVTADKVYRFRVISNTMTYAFRVSVDQHKMTVIATDGNDVTGFEVESVVVHSGERYDVTVRADQVPGSYWIRLETLDTPLQGKTSSPHSGLAILWYQDTELALPTSQRSVCDRNNPCKVLNCPFIYRPDSYIVCTSVAELKASREEQDTYPVANVSSTETFQEIFLNFGFAWTRNPVSAAVNNKVNVLPSVPLQLYPDLSETFTECVQRCDEYCTCTHVVKLGIGNTVQLVLLNTNDSPYGMAHPIHIHGHRPHLIKMVYPEYDKRGRISNSTKDIQCDTPRCNNATWRNPSWKFGNVPDVDLVSPTRKDTVIVPRQGYVVLRMVADNPGYWFMHCHIEVHQVFGMSLVLQAGEVTDMPPLPRGFPTCGGYRPDTEIKENTSLLKRLGDVPETDDDCTAWKNASRKSMRNQRIGYILLDQG